MNNNMSFLMLVWVSLTYQTIIFNDRIPLLTKNKSSTKTSYKHAGTFLSQYLFETKKKQKKKQKKNNIRVGFE